MNLDQIRYAVNNIRRRKLRSGLTVISILIGITAIFALVSFGFGIQNYIDEVAQEAGIDKLFIQAKGVGAPGTDENFQLTQDDVDFVDKINGVEEITGNYIKAVEVKKKKKSKFVFGFGYDVDKTEFIEEAFATDIGKGRQFRSGDTDKIILGYNYLIPDKLFEKPIDLGEKLEVNGKLFEVIGFFEEIGNPSDDANIYFTYEGMESIFDDIEDKYAFIMIRAVDNVDVSTLAETIQERLRKHKDQEEGKEDFFVQTFEDALATFTNIILVLNGILFLIALVSLIVASVNTMNTMYTAVVERTKEIGIMKAIGARNKDILFIFIFESGLMGMIGGIAGVIFGYLIASAGGGFAAAAGFASLQPSFPLGLVASCIGFSFLVGALSGILPARQAARLKPVDALRYE